MEFNNRYFAILLILILFNFRGEQAQATCENAYSFAEKIKLGTVATSSTLGFLSSKTIGLIRSSGPLGYGLRIATPEIVAANILSGAATAGATQELIQIEAIKTLITDSESKEEVPLGLLFLADEIAISFLDNSVDAAHSQAPKYNEFSQFTHNFISGINPLEYRATTFLKNRYLLREKATFKLKLGGKPMYIPLILSAIRDVVRTLNRTEDACKGWKTFGALYNWDQMIFAIFNGVIARLSGQWGEGFNSSLVAIESFSSIHDPLVPELVLKAASTR